MSTAEGNRCCLQEALLRCTENGPSGLCLLGLSSLHGPHLDSTLAVVGALESPFCSQSFFLVMSPATMSWGQKEGQLQTAAWGFQASGPSVLPHLAGGLDLPACLRI